MAAILSLNVLSEILPAENSKQHKSTKTLWLILNPYRVLYTLTTVPVS